MNLTTVRNFGPTWPVGCRINGPRQFSLFTLSHLRSESETLTSHNRWFDFRFPVSAHNSATMGNPSSSVGVRKPITHVVFDMDGLLLDTEKFYTEVQEIILARYNKTFEWPLKAKMMGMKAIEAAKVFVEETGISDSLSADQFLVEREDMLRSLFPTSELMPGVSRLLKHLHAKGVPIAVATGSHKRHFELKTQRHGEMFSLMHHVVLGDDPEVKQGKPSPDVFLAAARRFEGGPVDPSNILVFEDAPSGVRAAKNAGMSVVMIPDPRLDKSFQDAADQVLNSLLDFNPSEWSLPPFEDNGN
ncbi:putative glycerol-1-phosphatase [Medicago truncatula]|uniref:glycerol-1-phosphatase n=2 Tax=Medicago truncatula TaxID=3880 RepID=G7JVF5_MEDTR|nr:(DL)-glycerol-3-phosphatase 2 [Medicago truncatula]AES92314.1 haloacid dehalogenase-like hydrolase [Medicago truncatula]RHN64741.1 putative glycerol-1-phosphatase [Medicago truncatula]